MVLGTLFKNFYIRKNIDYVLFIGTHNITGENLRIENRTNQTTNKKDYIEAVNKERNIKTKRKKERKNLDNVIFLASFERFGSFM